MCPGKSKERSGEGRKGVGGSWGARRRPKAGEDGGVGVGEGGVRNSLGAGGVLEGGVGEMITGGGSGGVWG